MTSARFHRVLFCLTLSLAFAASAPSSVRASEPSAPQTFPYSGALSGGSEQDPSEAETPEEWLKRLESEFAERKAQEALDEQEALEEEEEARQEEERSESDAAPAEPPSAEPRRSVGALPEDQERDIKLRREAIQKQFTANEIRKARRRIEMERLYRERQEELALIARRDHVPTANFGHVYHREFHYRGEYKRYDRLASGESIGEYYGGNWKHVPVDTALAAVLPGRYPHRTHNAQYFYRAVLERSLEKSRAAQDRVYRHMRSPF